MRPKMESGKAIYEEALAALQVYPNVTLPPMASRMLQTDPIRMAFMLSRYKFAARMLDGKSRLLEIGCQDGFGTAVVAPHFESVTAVDYYAPHISDAVQYVAPVAANVDFRQHDMTEGPIGPNFDGAFSLDVVEHIIPDDTGLFLGNIAKSLTDDGILVLGAPSLESQIYASEGSRRSHINCMSGRDLKLVCEKFFKNVLLFGMNDEVLHTGFPGMSHYLLCVCVAPRRSNGSV